MAEYFYEGVRIMLEIFLYLVCLFGFILILNGFEHFFPFFEREGVKEGDRDYLQIVSGIVILTVIYLLTPFG
ncbi:hypothetical protein N9S06_02855 [Gammaproteobacteria bacterium]|nr:hypothetical protein [Gammaproteobacteria bacterium]